MSRSLDRIVVELETLLDRQREILTGVIDEARADEYVMGARRIRQLFSDLEASFVDESTEKGVHLPVDLAAPYPNALPRRTRR